MKTFGTRVYIWLLLFQTIHTDSYPETYNIFDKMTDLQELCPHSSFCGRNASSEISLPKNYSPCCRSCSCDKSCGLERNCCFQHLDKYKEKDNTICVSAVLENKVIRNALHFRMINKCLNTSTESAQTEHFCGRNSSLFQPVLSQDTGLIYYNEHCARCNEDERTIPWEIAFSCPPVTDNNLTEFIDKFINSEKSKGSPGCFAYYIPPPNIKVVSQTCEPNVIRKCNVTGILRVREQFWDFCEKFNATFTELKKGLVFGDAFCFLVELLPEEYDFNCLAVCFKVKNKTIYTFSKVTVQANEEMGFGAPSDEIRVRVCVDEFDLIAGVDSVNSLPNAALIVLIFIAFYRYTLQLATN